MTKHTNIHTHARTHTSSDIPAAAIQGRKKSHPASRYHGVNRVSQTPVPLSETEGNQSIVKSTSAAGRAFEKQNPCHSQCLRHSRECSSLALFEYPPLIFLSVLSLAPLVLPSLYPSYFPCLHFMLPQKFHFRDRSEQGLLHSSNATVCHTPSLIDSLKMAADSRALFIRLYLAKGGGA